MLSSLGSSGTAEYESLALLSLRTIHATAYRNVVLAVVELDGLREHSQGMFMTPAEAIAVVREALKRDCAAYGGPDALAALTLIEQRMEELDLELFAAQVNITPTPNELAERRRAEAAERERDDLKRRWEEDNLCGICPYRIAIQARIAQLEEALRDVVERNPGWSERARAALASGKERGQAAYVDPAVGGNPYPPESGATGLVNYGGLPGTTDHGRVPASGKEEA